MEVRQKPGLRKDGASMVRGILQFVHYKLTHTSEERWRLVFISVFISAIFWTLRMMGKNYTVNEPIAVQWKINSDGLALNKAHLPKTVQTSLSGMGWDLLRTRYNFRNQRPVLPGMVVGGSLVVNPVVARQVISRQAPHVQVNFVAVPEWLAKP